MAITYTNGSTGLFDILGKLAAAAGNLNTVRASTVKAKIDAAFNAYRDSAYDADRVQGMLQLPTSELSWRRGGDAFMGAIAAAAQQLLIAAITAEAPERAGTVAAALEYLIEQMVVDGRYVAFGDSLMSVEGTTGTLNTLEVTIEPGQVASVVSQYMFTNGELLQLEVETAERNQASMSILGGVAARSAQAEDYPLGSGINGQIAAISPAQSLLPNSDFSEDFVSSAIPGWQQVAGAGTFNQPEWPQFQVDLGTTTPEGSWALRVTIGGGPEHETADLNDTATAADVQAALRALPGLEETTVVEDSAFVWTITFVGTPGNIALGVLDNLTTGTPDFTELTSSWLATQGGRYLLIAGDEFESLTLRARVTEALTPGQRYVMAAYIKQRSATSSDIRLTLVADADGTPVVNSAGSDITVTVPLSGYTTAGWLTLTFDFPPLEATEPMYVEIAREDPSPDDGLIVFAVILAPIQPLYAGGPYVIPLVSDTPPQLGSTIDLLPGYDGAPSAWHKWMDVFFGARTLGLQLPTSGSTQISDALIA